MYIYYTSLCIMYIFLMKNKLYYFILAINNSLITCPLGYFLKNLEQ